MQIGKNSANIRKNSVYRLIWRKIHAICGCIRAIAFTIQNQMAQNPLFLPSFVWQARRKKMANKKGTSKASFS